MEVRKSGKKESTLEMGSLEAVASEEKWSVTSKIDGFVFASDRTSFRPIFHAKRVEKKRAGSLSDRRGT